MRNHKSDRYVLSILEAVLERMLAMESREAEERRRNRSYGVFVYLMISVLVAGQLAMIVLISN